MEEQEQAENRQRAADLLDSWDSTEVSLVVNEQAAITSMVEYRGILTRKQAALYIVRTDAIALQFYLPRPSVPDRFSVSVGGETVGIHTLPGQPGTQSITLTRERFL